MDTHKPHVTPLIVYLGVGASLLVLTVVTVLAAGVDLGPFNLLLAMAIATLKAGLVGMIFMHLLYDNKFYLMIFLSSILFLAIFISLTMLDTERRGDITMEEAGPIKAKAMMYENMGNVSPSTGAETQPQH